MSGKRTGLTTAEIDYYLTNGTDDVQVELRAALQHRWSWPYLTEMFPDHFPANLSSATEDDILSIIRKLQATVHHLGKQIKALRDAPPKHRPLNI